MTGCVVLLTDFGTVDPYVGIMKGVITSINPSATIIDFTHSIKRHDIVQASFLLKKSFRFFPKEAVFVAVIDPGVGTSRQAISASADGYFFVGPDNGIFSHILDQAENKKIVRITNQKIMLTQISFTFHGRDVFAPAAAHLSSGLIGIEELGEVTDAYKKLSVPEPIIKENEIIGSVLFSDHFGNLITNIDEELLKNKKIKIIEAGSYKINEIKNTYGESPVGTISALIGSYGTLELAVNRGSASRLIGNSDKLFVTVKF